MTHGRLDMTEEPTDGRTWAVVINDEEQYSIWAADVPFPAGWRATGVTGSRPECLRHIDEVWTDLRPLSLRRWAAAEGGR
jgi:MbtH protein